MFAGVQRPVVRPPSPDRLDEMLRIRNPLGWITLSVLAAATFVGLVWSCVSTAAVKVDARGILLSVGGVVDIPAPAEGRLLARRVEIGDMVAAGTVVAELAQPDQDERLQAKLRELEGAERERQQLVAFHAQTQATQVQLGRDRTGDLNARIAALGARIATLAEIEQSTQSLSERGISTRNRVLEVQSERMRNQSELAEARSTVLQIAAETESRETQNARELLNTQLKLDALRREIEILRSSLSRATLVQAPVAGRISEIAAANGELIRTGAPLLRLLPQGAGENELVARLYVAGGNGKRVKVGMSAQVVPATARLQRDGFIDGEVIRVAALPTTPESMQSVLKNSALVTSLTAEGPPYEILVRLLRDPASPSGFKWSTGRGLTTPPDGGTIADAKFVVDRIPLIALVIPRAETVLGWLRP